MKLDVSKLTAKLEAIPKRTEREVKDSLEESGKDLKQRSKAVAPYLPVDDEQGGAKHLRDAAYSEVSKGVGGPEMDVGYEGPEGYLFVQHEGFWVDYMGRGEYKEIKNYTTPGTGPKFLENPWNERKGVYKRDLGNSIRRGLG